jgi:predicted DNA-binding transcriptional regulator AlpA
MESDRLIRLPEVGELLGHVSAKTIRRKIAAGELPQPVYVGRTPMLCISDVIAAIERLKEQRKTRHKL